MARAKQQPATRGKAKAAPGKENQPSQKTKKKTVNINAIYDAPQSHKRKRNDEEETEAYSTRKVRVADPGFFAKRAAREQEPQQGFFKQFATKRQGFGFAAAFQPYLEAVDASFEEQWATYQQQCKNRENGLDEEGFALEAPIPTEADLAALRQQIAELNNPIENDLMEVRTGKGNAKMVVQKRVSDTLNTWNQEAAQARQDLGAVEKKLTKIEKEMEGLKRELMNESTANVDSECSAQMKLFEQEVEKIEKQAEAERAQLKKDQRAARKEFDRKLEELMESTL